MNNAALIFYILLLGSLGYFALQFSKWTIPKPKYRWFNGPEKIPKVTYNKKQQAERDGQLIAFCRLYEQTRRKRSIQLSYYANLVAEHFPLLETDLRNFSQLLTTSGKEAYTWLQGRFPKRHLFIRQVCIFLETAESLKDPSDYLKKNAEMLEKLSADRFKTRSEMEKEKIKAFNNIPMMLMFLMVILLLLEYTKVVSKNIQY
ncbi:hypothetical protein ACFOQM_04100 [Paenibacillus sp. GCM10012307]|uniref:Uncharacterized protein n=1 Tax=Paenibacillus roseus TaxID=2798579 RepID=A0A934J0J1_9BACL|nr:hypothetical protein [Paenibacillus roseus]MBJ6360495.1 hypothetical protein [Paenibacillus roseus]